MPHDTLHPRTLKAADHPENRIEPGSAAETPSAPEAAPLRPGYMKALLTAWLTGAIGCLLTLMTVAGPLGAGDVVAAVSLLPLALAVIAIVNGWVATAIFMSSKDPGDPHGQD